MTLTEGIRLVEDLIRENPSATVRDFIETLKRIDRVDRTFEQRLHIDELAIQGLIFRDHSKLIRTPAEKYELPTHERQQRYTA